MQYGRRSFTQKQVVDPNRFAVSREHDRGCEVVRLLRSAVKCQ
jgi:hypothetical protein